MAHILQNNDMVTEMYLCDSSIPTSKNLLIIHRDGHVELKWCYGDIIEKQINPVLLKVGNRMMVEYGEPNLFQIRQRLPFQDELGKLDTLWEKLL